MAKHSKNRPNIPTPLTVDVAILTTLPEEYHAVRRKLHDPRTASKGKDQPNLFAEMTGMVLYQQSGQSYRILLAMIGRAGTVNSALAVEQLVRRWEPRYVFMVGIAGGLHCDGLSIGDIVISNTIYGYEYGKIDKQFIPRPNWVFAADIGLFTSISAFAELSPAWQETIDAERPLPGVPRVVSGNVASGDKVVDNPNNNFFRQVLANYPKTIAVEMEGAGAAQAIQNLRDAGIRVGFLMVRGISDMPREENVTDGENGQKERDRWKPYAAASAAAFLVAYIASGLPLSPGEPTDQPALSPAASVPMHDFQTSYFTGRKTELKKLLPLLQPGKTITIVGPAGVGKTTLVAEALAQLSAKGNLAQRFPDGTFFYSFQQRAEANIALEQIARWFGVDELVPDIGLAANRALKSKKALLILDGTEEADDLPRVLSAHISHFTN